jgi:hypothetical protein
MTLLARAIRVAAIAAVLAAPVVPAGALAQVPAPAATKPGVIIGVVTDVSKQRLPGVMIRVRTAASARTVVTDVHGRYRVAGLPLGSHRVVAELSGFAPTAKEIELTSRYPESDASFVMYVGTPEETVIVPGSPRYRVWPLVPGR